MGKKCVHFCSSDWSAVLRKAEQLTFMSLGTLLVEPWPAFLHLTLHGHAMLPRMLPSSCRWFTPLAAQDSATLHSAVSTTCGCRTHSASSHHVTSSPRCRQASATGKLAARSGLTMRATHLCHVLANAAPTASSR